MCVIIARYFPDKGWVGAKNRDRNYIPEVNFVVSEKDGIERLVFHDKVTDYKEGINSNGVAILSASLMVQDDEKEYTKTKGEHKSPDGNRIFRALLQKTAIEAARAAVKEKLTGNTIIFDRDNLFLLESYNKDGKYVYKCRKIPHDQTVARTNHGVWLDWAGYQRVEGDDAQTLSRISSEARLLQAQAIVDSAENEDDMVNGLCKIYVDHPQLNVMRTSTENKKMRTTAQEMIVPSERTIYCRPVSSHIEFDFWKLNRPDTNCWVEILSNRALWQNTKGDPPFTSNGMKHTSDK